MDIRNKIVVITGSSSGIGQTLAQRFAQEGATLVVTYHENREGAEETLHLIQQQGSKGIIVKADVSNSQDITSLFSTVVSNYNAVDILINNAAIGTDKVPFMDASYDNFLEMINTNLIGPMLCSQMAIKQMLKQRSGKIINTSSIRGAEYGGRAVVYAATKAAINSMTKTLAKQVAPTITVNAVAPGFVQTRSYDKVPQETIDGYINQTYLKRWITKDEIADAFIFVAKNDGITGQVIYVDGGFTLK